VRRTGRPSHHACGGDRAGTGGEPVMARPAIALRRARDGRWQ